VVSPSGVVEAKKLGKVLREVQVPLDDVGKEKSPHPVKLESSLNPGESTRNFCMSYASGRLRRGRGRESDRGADPPSYLWRGLSW
jgi:hypothetical protein